MMCGLYGFHRRAAAPDGALLRHLAALAGTRGPHAHGQATQAGRVVGLGPLDPAQLSTPVDSVIGHARLATSGAADDLTCAQPLHVGALFVAHNGTVPAAAFHALRHAVTLTTGSDSEVLARLLARAPHPSGWPSVLDLLTPGVPLALLALLPEGGMIAARRGHPLHALRRPEGTYLCSLPFDGSLPLPDQTVTHLDVDGVTAYPLSTTASLRAAAGGPQWTP